MLRKILYLILILLSSTPIISMQKAHFTDQTKVNIWVLYYKHFHKMTFLSQKITIAQLKEKIKEKWSIGESSLQIKLKFPTADPNLVDANHLQAHEYIPEHVIKHNSSSNPIRAKLDSNLTVE